MEKQHNFEKQIRTLLKKPNDQQLDRSNWLKIKSELLNQRRKSKRRRLSFFSAAAMILILVGAFSFLERNQVERESEVLAQYGLTQFEYPKAVNERISALPKTKIAKSSVQHLDILKSQLHFLDRQYVNYLEYIDQNGYQEYIGKQIQNYYEVKIELLDKIQSEIQKLKIQNNENIYHQEAVEWNI